MRVDELMSVRVVAVGPEETADAAWLRMQRERIRHLAVIEGSRLVGMLSERDLGGRGGADLRRGRLVRELMTPRVATASPGTTLRQAANVMHGRLIGSLPVVDCGRVVGIVTATDVLEELGRGSTRPAVRAKRRGMRLPPASARKAARRAGEQGRREKRVARRGKSAAKKNTRREGNAAEARALAPTSAARSRWC